MVKAGSLSKSSGHRKVLTVFNFLVPILTTIVVITLIVCYARRKNKGMMEYADYTVNQIAQELSEDISTTIGYGKSSMMNIATLVSQVEISELESNPSKYISPLIENSPFNNIEFIRKDGMNVMNIGAPFDASDRVYYIEGISGKSGIWNNYHPKMSKSTLINFYSPLVKDETVNGVITGYIEADNQLFKNIKQRFFNQSAQGILYDENYYVIATSLNIEYEPDLTLSSLLYKLAANEKLYNQYLSLIVKATPEAVRYTGSKGEGRFCIKDIPGTRWKVAVIIPSRSFRSVFGEDLEDLLLLVSCILIVLLLYVFYIVTTKARENKKIRKVNTSLELENKKFNIEQKKTYDELSNVNLRLEKAIIEQKRNLNIVSSLSQDYLNVYTVRPDDNLVRILKLNGYVTEGITSEVKEYPYDALCLKYINDRVYSEDVEMMKKVMDASNILKKLEEDSQYVGTYRVIDKDEIHYYQYKYVRIPGSNAFIAGFQNVDTMIMEEKEQQDKLKEALQTAQKANEAKSVFLSNMSHDIRTPMNAIIGYSEMIRKEVENPEKVLDYQKKLHDSSELLLQIINNVLDMARIESGKMVLDETYFYADKNAFEDILDIFSQTIKEKNLKIINESNIQHKHILMDRVKVHEILNNLVSNAIKYTPENGTIKCITNELPCDREGYVLYETVIEDTGIGMSEEFLPTLFDSFSRERNTTTGKVAGAGLGMSIVKALVNLMGGTIKAESKLGSGTKFTIQIYLKIADENYYTEKKNKTEISKPCFKGKRILLTEDNELNTEIATAILKEAGFEVEHAADGVVCVDMIDKAEAGYYDLILMDIQMPNMDGFTATRTIRQLSVKGKSEIPIVAMTANAFEEDKKKSFEAGMNGHVAKPINVEELMKILAQIVE